MAVIFPLPWGSFMGIMPVQSAAWRLERFEEIARTADQFAHVRDLADPRWAATVTFAAMEAREAAHALALLELHGHARPFLLHDPHHMSPALHPAGADITAVTVHSVGTTSLRLQGLPAGYALSIGDRLAIAHSGASRTMHRVVEATVAAGTGITPFFDVVPQPRPQAAAGQVVALRWPVGFMLIRPGSLKVGEPDRMMVRGVGFEAVEAD